MSDAVCCVSSSPSPTSPVGLSTDPVDFCTTPRRLLYIIGYVSDIGTLACVLVIRRGSCVSHVLLFHYYRPLVLAYTMDNGLWLRRIYAATGL